MGEEEVLKDFVSTVANMPHIATKVIGYLDIVDLANCLKSCKALRKFVSDALRNSRKLQRCIDKTVMEKSWRASKTYSLDFDKSAQQMCPIKMFGLDNHLWISLGRSFKKTKNYRLVINDLENEEMTSISTDKVPNMEILSNGSVMVDDGQQVRIINCQDGKMETHLVLQHDCNRSREHGRLPWRIKKTQKPKTSLTHTLKCYCIFDHANKGKEDEHLTLFNSHDGMQYQPIYLHKMLAEIQASTGSPLNHGVQVYKRVINNEII